MTTVRKPVEPSKRRAAPATSLEGRENQLIAQAVDLAERQIAEGTASAQVISHFLKLGTTRERLEQEKLRNENKLTEAKIESLASMQRVEELYSKAMQAFGTYSGQSPEEYDD